MKLNKLLTTLTLLGASALAFQGCQTHQHGPDGSHVHEAAPAKSSPTGYSMGSFETDLLTLDKKVLKESTIGETIAYSYVLTAKENITDVTINDVIPEGLEYISSSPAATVSGSNLTWNLGDMDAGSSAEGTLELRATKEGTFTNCATASAIPQACTYVVIGKPMLTITKDVAVERLLLGDTADFTIVVTNTGTSVAKNVVVADTLPTGLTTSAPLSYSIGDLAPGESKTIALVANTTTKGEFCNIAQASGSNVATVQDDACVVVVKPGLIIEKTGETEKYIGKTADYKIVVSNNGDVDLQDVAVTDTPYGEMTIVKAPGASVANNTASWNIASLPAGASKEFSLTTTSRVAGKFCNAASAVDVDVDLSATDSACTLWKGFPAVLLEVIDTVDPLLLGERSTYIIRVTNQGSANDYDVAISAKIPAELKILSISGSTAGTHTSSTASFSAYPTLAPKKIIEYRIEVEAVKEGSARSYFELDTDLLGDPITEIEATQVY